MEYHRVLIIDDKREQRLALAHDLVKMGYLCEPAQSVPAARSLADGGSCAVAIVRLHADEVRNVALLEELEAMFSELPVIVWSDASASSEVAHVIKRAAFHALSGASGIDDLHREIAVAIATHAQRQSQTSVLFGDAKLVHESDAMLAMLEVVEAVAQSVATVLIEGETGTGKEVVARMIHARGPRRALPFVAVNATAIPEQLLESELFGHVRGAYTGAERARRGLVAAANRGTLLLDEIGDMPRALQPKLLRTLQFGEVRPVGSDDTSSVDVRIIAATHRDLNALVDAGTFRSDLRYRLNTLVVRVPPLRERSADIPGLVGGFLAAARSRTPLSWVTSFSDEAMQLLKRNSWPGNVRQLESAVERVVVLARHAQVTADDLAFLESPAPRSDGSWRAPAGARIQTLREMNQEYLAWVLVQTGGDKARAAKLLGIDLSTLYRWQRGGAKQEPDEDGSN